MTQNMRIQTLKQAALGATALTLLGATALTLIALPAAAQLATGQTTTPRGQLEEITVTAERREAALQKTPLAVSAFSGNMLAERQINNVREAAANVPGILIQTTTGVSNAARIFMRGVGQDNAGLFFDPSVGVYVDNVYYPRINGAFFDFFDIERLEVLRGPQGTLYGRNTSAGAIKIISKSPSYDQYSVAGDVAFGSYSTIDVRGYVSAPIIDGKVAASVSGLHRSRDGLTTDVGLNNQKVNDKAYDAGRVKLLFTPDDKLRVEVSLDGVYDKSDPFIATTPITLATKQQVIDNIFTTNVPGATGAPLPFYSDFYTTGAAINAKYDLGNGLAINSITGVRSIRTALILPILAVAPGVTANTSYNIHDWTASQELNVTFNLDKWKGVAGIYGFREYGTDREYYANPQLLRSRETDALAGYAQATYQVLPSVGITGGLRYTYERAVVSQLYPTLRSYEQTAGTNFYSLIPKVGIEWQAMDQLLAYASYTKGFKSGGFNSISPTANVGIPGREGFPISYAPEKVDSYEAGIKYETPDHKLRINPNIFFADYYAGLQYPVFFPGTVTSTTQNVGAANVLGFELEVNWQPIPELNVYASGNVQHGWYSKGWNGLTNSASQTLTVGQTKDLKLKNLIPNKTAVGFVWEVPLGIPGQLRIGGEWDHTDAYWNNTSNSNPLERTRSTELFNAFVAYDTPDGHWTISVEGKNLTDERYYATVLQVSSPTNPLTATYPADPLIMLGRIKFKWDVPVSRSSAVQSAAYVAPVQKPIVPKSYLVFFDFDRADLTPEGSKIVDTAAVNAKAGSVTRLEVTGHADRSGSDAYNQRLSQRRAETVKAQLLRSGFKESEIVTFAKGESQPLVATPDGVREPQNRRVEIIYK
ncbi:TonB-dependent receptor domain-containing protein [Roseiterribacter gracilis]|uniref:TonB-dependent receptor n=1 Tax=Roseiterribacter gracilis TaxID=2812848 RepID=A0A8S8X7M7_9PROT|nr:TonB-dependent receptor [Rhodospirillales bacterium TMPK1]